MVTQPDKPHGRSRSVLVPPPVKLLADSERIPVLQPERPSGDVFLAALRFPMMSLRVSALIRLQGGKLWLRRLPVVPRPPRPSGSPS